MEKPAPELAALVPAPGGPAPGKPSASHPSPEVTPPAQTAGAPDGQTSLTEAARAVLADTSRDARVKLSRVYQRWSQPQGADEDGSLAIDPSARQLYSLHQGRLKAWSLDGRPLWTASPPQGSKLLAGPVCGPQGQVVARGRGGSVVCYDSKGQLLWSVNGLPEFGEEPPLPPLVAADGTVYVLTNNPSYSLGQPEHRLRALREGRVLWERDLYSPAFQACGLGLGPDGTLYVAGALPQSRSLLDRFFKELPPELPHLLAFDPDGKVRWAGPVESWTAWARSCLTRGPNGVIYASCGQNSPHLTAFQADGRKLWDFRLPEPYDSQARIHGAPLVDEAGNLYLVCLARPGQGKGLICSVDPGGKLRWVRWLSDGASGRPALLREGRLWVEQNGGLTAYNSGSGEWEVDWPLHPNAEAPTRSLVADPAGNLYVNVSGDILALSREALRTSEAAGPESARIFSDEEWVEVGGVRLPRKPAEKL